MKKQLLWALTLLLLTTGCSMKLGEFTMISTKDIDFKKEYIKDNKKVMGKDEIQIYVIFPSRMHPDIDVAVSDVLERTCSDYLTDATIMYKYWYIPYIYGKAWYQVEGYTWREKGKESCE